MSKREFPLLKSNVPFELLEPHEAQAMTNHSQNLLRLASRGGLHITEMVAVLENRRWHPMPLGEAHKRLGELLIAHEQASEKITSEKGEK